MKTDETLTREYLAAVERETSTLPAAARQELIADLGEHIEVALAERPGSVHEILREVGDPRAIAATALQELGGTAGVPARKPGRRRSPAWLPLVLLVVGDVLPYLGGIALTWIGFAARVAAVVIVCRARCWTVAQKWTGLTLAVIVPVVAHVAWYFSPVPHHGSPAEPVARWTLVAVVFLLTLAGAGWLWRNRRRA
ncbi:HAAS signaling domain-containing protein [Streptomyces sp. NPDC050529]|uniref:HAAS signaling domain-containing protein n=1 Tax=Streptomyces sp. NPDC050529 TaxID=3365624 RepID=UPI0037A7C3C7